MPVSSWVNSVEFIDAVISGSNNSVSYNLSKGQNYANCIPFYTVCGNSNYYDNRLTDVTFSGTTNSGIIRFDRSNNRATSCYVKCYVVEFNPEQVRVQQGSFTLTGTTTQTITLPTTVSGTDRTAITFSWKSDDTIQYQQNSAVRGRVVNSNSIDFYRCGNSSTCTGHWFLFEDLQNNFRVRHLSNSYVNSQTLNIDNQKVIDPLRTFILGSYANDSVNTYPFYFSSRIFLYSIGTIRSDKSQGSYTTYWATQVVEIQDKTKIYVPMDHAITTWTSPAIYNRSVGGVSGRVPFVCNMETSTVVVGMMQGFARGESSDNTSIRELMVSAELTASGTITHTKVGTSYSTSPSYTVAVDWAGIPVDTGTNSDPISEDNGPNESFVKSVENFRFTLQGNLGVYVLTKGQIASNCAIFSSNRSTTSDALSAILVNVYITEPGLVYMQHWNETDQTIVDVSVVEFYPNQVKVQQLCVNNTTNTTVNVSIDEISSVNKAFILSSVFTTYDGYISGLRYSLYRVRLTNTTNVELYQAEVGYESICSFFVVEDLQDNFVTAHCNRSFVNNDSFFNDTYNWGVHNSFPIVTYTTDCANDYPFYCAVRCMYTSEFRPIYCDKASGGYTIYWSGTIVKFLDEKRHTFPLSISLSTTSSATGYYNSELRGTENITAYNVSQYSTAYCNTSDNIATSESFGTITIKNYNTGEYEVSKGGVNYTNYFGVHIINWPGFHYQHTNNITGTQTKSFINSLQKDSFNTDAGTIQLWLRYNQDITKCVPFISNSIAASDGYNTRMHKTIYRYEDPDCFRVRFGSNNTSARKVLTYIVEFNQDIKIQYGSGYSLGTTKTFTIQQVNLNRTFIHFFTSNDAWERSRRSSSICGYFSSSTEITFIRNDAVQGMYISWYVVECPDWGADSYWTVYRNTLTNPTGNPIYSWLPVQPAIERTIFLASYATDEASGYPFYGIWRIFNRQDHGIEMDIQQNGYSMTKFNIEAIEFSTSLAANGFKVYSNFYTLNSINPLDIDLRLNPYDSFHINRSMLISAQADNMTRVDTSDWMGYQESSHCLEFKDTNNDEYSNTITVSKIGNSYPSYGFYYAIQFPKYNKYYFSGYVRELGIPVSRKVVAYKTSSNELVGTTMSVSGTGYFRLETQDYEPHYIVAIDNDDGLYFNDLIYGKIYPTAISGAFAWVTDYPTFSGIGEYTT